MKLPIDFQNFSGGYCSKPVQDNEAAEMLDCYVRRDGALVGTLPYVATGNDIGGTFLAYYDSEAGTFAIATTGIYKLISGTWTSIATPSPAATTKYLGSIAQFDSTILFAHHDWTSLYKYDGTTCEAVALEETYAELAANDPARIAAISEALRARWEEVFGGRGHYEGFGQYLKLPYPGDNEAKQYLMQIERWSYADMNTINQRKHTVTFSPDLVAVDSQFCYATNGNKIFYTPDPANWNPNIYLMPEADDAIISLQVLFGRLYIFKKSGISVKTSGEEVDWSIEKVSNEPCCSRVAVSPQGVYYLGPDCLMRFDGSRSVKVSAKLDPSTLKSSVCEPRVFYSSRTNQVFIPASDGYLYVWDELMDRWHRRSYSDIICMREAFYEPAGKTTEFTIGYTGIHRCNITKLGYYLYSVVGGVPDSSFTLPAVIDGGTEGTVDLREAAVATYADLETWLNALTDYDAQAVSATTTASTSLEDTPSTGVTDNAHTFRGAGGSSGSFMRISMLSSGRTYEEDTGGGMGSGGKLVTKCLDFGSPELYKRPSRLYFDGTVAYADLYSDRYTNLEATHYNPARINYYAPSGALIFNFTMELGGVEILRSMRFVADGVAV